MTDVRTPAEINAAEREATAKAELAELDRAKRVKEDAEWEDQSALRKRVAVANTRSLELKNAESVQASVSKLIPDLSGVDKGSTTVAEGPTILQALLGGRALQDAASGLIPVMGGLGKSYRILISTDLELAAQDADFVQVSGTIEKLLNTLVEFRARARHTGPPDTHRQALNLMTGAAVAGLADGAAKLLTGLLSLLAAKRTITTTSSTIDNDAAMLAVAGAIIGAEPSARVVIDKARLLDTGGPTQSAWNALQDECRELANDIDNWESDTTKSGIAEDARRLLDTCQSALAALVSTGEGARFSPLTSATILEVLHSEDFDALLIIKGTAASTTQLIDDRPLRFGDPISVVSTATISYLLIDHRDRSRVLASGLSHGVSQLNGKIGSQLPVPALHESNQPAIRWAEAAKKELFQVATR